GLCDVDAVKVLVGEGPGRVEELIALGAVFDTHPGGGLALTREGGHSTARVVHAGGAATGAEIERALVEAVRETAAALLEGWFAVDLLVEGGRCQGVVALDPRGRAHEVRAAHVVLASGGAGQLYAVTTNPSAASGDGIAMALRRGVPVADVEFMQFHPTALHHPAMPRPLLSGGLLTDLDGASALPGLWACGEVACTGVHGANRLASNSLLEGMVFAARVVEAIADGREGPEPTGAIRTVLDAPGDGDTIPVRSL